MSGFIKYKAPDVASQCFTSGIPSLDKLVAMTEGSFSCIYEDPNALIHNTLLQTFVSSCEAQNQPYYVLGCEEKVLVRFQEQVDSTDEESRNLTIAWRYKELTQRTFKFKWNMLSKLPLAENTVLKTLDELLDTLRTKKRLKAVVFSLFGSLFGHFSTTEIFNILYEIRKWTRMNHHVLLVSVPQFLLAESTLVFFDNILKIHSNLIHPHEVSLYISFLEVIKSGSVGALRVNGLESAKYGIALRSKRIDIERIDIPPEDAVHPGGCTPSF